MVACSEVHTLLTINDFTEKKILWKDLEVSLQILGFSTASESSFENILVFSSGVRPKPLFWFRSKLADTFSQYHNRYRNHILKEESSKFIMGIFLS